MGGYFRNDHQSIRQWIGCQYERKDKTEQRLLSFTVFRVMRFNEAGLIQFWKWKMIEQNKPKHPANRIQLSQSATVEPEPTLTSFNLEKFYPIFLVYFVGISLSAMAFIYEVFFFIIWRRLSAGRIATCP